MRESRDETKGLWVGGLSVCVWNDRDTIDVKDLKADTQEWQDRVLGEDVTNLSIRFEQGVKISLGENRTCPGVFCDIWEILLHQSKNSREPRGKMSR
jgi:hypothetical protein